MDLNNLTQTVPSIYLMQNIHFILSAYSSLKIGLSLSKKLVNATSQ